MSECRTALALSFFARSSINGRHSPATVLRRTLCAVRSVANNQTSWSCYGLEASSSLLIALVSFFICNHLVALASASETVWCSPHCMPEINITNGLFAELSA